MAAVLVGATVGQLIIGAWVSFTVTRNEQVLVNPTASVTRKTTVVCPFGKDIPVVGPLVCITALGGRGQLSEPEGVAKLTNAVHSPGALPTLILAGQAMVGACVSITVMVKAQVAVLARGVAVSEALHTTVVVVPMGKLLPLAVLGALCRVTLAVPQLSVAVGCA